VGTDDAVAGGDAAERYEELRRRALAGEPDGFALGQAVLLRRGVMASCSAGPDALSHNGTKPYSTYGNSSRPSCGHRREFAQWMRQDLVGHTLR
jgi:hypothetical protein